MFKISYSQQLRYIYVFKEKWLELCVLNSPNQIFSPVWLSLVLIWSLIDSQWRAEGEGLFSAQKSSYSKAHLPAFLHQHNAP